MSAPVYLGRLYPRHAAAWACATGWGARMVRRGKAPQAAVADALRTAVRAIEPEPMFVGSPGFPAEQAIVCVLTDAMGQEHVQAVQAEREVAKVLAPLLDARMPLDTIRHAARAAAGERLDEDEVEVVVRREVAWWTRLHASLPEPANRAVQESVDA